MPAKDTERAIPSPEQETAESGYIARAGDHSFLLQAIMENQRTLGELKSTLEDIKATVDKHGGKLDSLSHRIYAAGAVLIVILAIAGFILDKIWDQLITLLAAGAA